MGKNLKGKECGKGICQRKAQSLALLAPFRAPPVSRSTRLRPSFLPPLPADAQLAAFGSTSRRVREANANDWARRNQRIETMLKQNRIDTATVATDEDYVEALIKLFKQR